MKTFLLFSSIAGVFFYKFFLFGYIPFPGDLLVSEYKPWRTYSYLGYNPGSYPQKAQYFDTLRQLYPWKTFTIDSLKHHGIPLWNPYNFAGSPLLANSQSAIFYPFNILYFFLSQPIAWSLLIIIQPLLACVGTYLYLRSIKVGNRGSIFGAIIYGYCMYMSTFLEYNTIGHAIIWLPFLLLAVEKSSVLLFVLSAVSAAFAGHLQIFVYIMIFCAIYTCIRKRRLVILFVLSIAISGIQLIPTAELITHAARAPQEYTFLIEKLLLQPYQLALFLSADLFGNPATRNYLLSDSYPGNSIYIGLVAFLFALLGLRMWKKNSFSRLFGIASLLLIIFMTRSPLTEFFYRIPLPFFSTASPTNGIFLLSFCLSVLAGIGIDAWLVKPDKKTKKILLTVAGAFLFFWIARFVDPKIISQKNLIFSTLLFITTASLISFGLAKKTKKKYIYVMLLILTIADSWYFFQKFNSFVPKELVFPDAKVFTWLADHQGTDRFWSYAGANIEANFATQYKLYSPEGYDPLYPKWYGQLLWAKDGKLLRTFDNTNRSDGIVTDKKLLNTLGVKYILDRTENASTEETFPPDQYHMVYNENEWKIFENLKSTPRAIMVNDYQLYTNATEFETAFFDTAFNPQHTVLLERDPSIQLSKAPSGTASIISYKANEVIMRVDTPSDQLLVLSDTYYPGWKATVDGIDTGILKANWAFRAVSVPKGAHTVTFEYKPASFSMGVKTSMIGVVGLALYLYIKRKKV